MARDGDRRLATFVRSMYGTFTTRHAAACGLDRQQRRARVEAGEWVRLFQGVYRLSSAPGTWQGDLLAACWAGGFRAVASHRSAAALWGMPGGRRHIAEITCPRWQRARHEAVVVHERTRLDLAWCTFVDGIPTTGPELTLVGLAAVCSRSLLEAAVDDAEHRGLTDPARLWSAVDRLGGRGRRGIGRLRALLEHRNPRAAVPESVMESRLRQALRACGLPEPVVQYEIRVGGRFVARVDAAYPDARIAIEYDSYAHHGGRRAIVRDSERRARLLAAGWLPFTATHDELRAGCPTLGPAVARALRRAS
jgi:hypothetical protein